MVCLFGGKDFSPWPNPSQSSLNPYQWCSIGISSKSPVLGRIMSSQVEFARIHHPQSLFTLLIFQHPPGDIQSPCLPSARTLLDLLAKPFLLRNFYLPTSTPTLLLSNKNPLFFVFRIESISTMRSLCLNCSNFSLKCSFTTLTTGQFWFS